MSDEHELFLAKSETDVTQLQAQRTAHREDGFEVPVSGGICELIVFVFMTHWLGARVFWSLPALWKAAGSGSKMKAGEWTGSWWRHWEQMFNSLGIRSPPHLMRTAATRTTIRKGKVVHEPIKGLLHRCLPSRAVSSFGLFPLLARLSADHHRKAGDGSDCRSWRAIMSGLIARMTILAVIFTVVVSTTPNTMISPGVPINGDRITRLDVQGGLIDLTPLIEQGEFQSQLAGLCPNGFNKVPLADLMVDLVEGGMGSFFNN